MEILDTITSTIPSNSGAWKASTMLLLLFVAAIAWPVMLKYWNMRNKHDEILNDFDSLKDNIDEIKEITSSMITIQRNQEQLITVEFINHINLLPELLEKVIVQDKQRYDDIIVKLDDCLSGDKIDDDKYSEILHMLSDINGNTLTSLTITHTLISKMDELKNQIQQSIGSGCVGEKDIRIFEDGIKIITRSSNDMVSSLNAIMTTFEANIKSVIDTNSNNIIENNDIKIKEFVDEMYFKIKDISRELKSDNIKELENLLEKFKADILKDYEKP